MNNSTPIAEVSLASSVHAEMTILGAILVEPLAYDEAEQLEYDDFVLSSNRTIFARMTAMRDNGRLIDIVTLSQAMRDHHELESVGGVPYLASLSEGLPRRLTIESYVNIVKEKSQLRSIIRVCQSTIAMAEDLSVPADRLLAETDTRLMEIVAQRSTKTVSLADASVHEYERLMQEHNSKAEFIGIPTGNSELDQKIGGWVEGELSIIGGKPGQGKSSALIQSVVQCGQTGVPAHIFSPEMTKGQILRRIWAAVASMRFGLLRRPSGMSADDTRLIRDVMMEVAEWPLIIEDDPNLTVSQLVSLARISKRKNGTRLFGVDYLQKLRYLSKPEHRHVEVTDAAVKLANLAKTEQVAVVALSSLTEKGGRGKDAAPTLGDLRQSGDIQYEASTVVFIHREIDDETERIKDDGWMIVPKQRNGETGQFRVRYNNRLMFDTASSRLAASEPEQYNLRDHTKSAF